MALRRILRRFALSAAPTIRDVQVSAVTSSRAVLEWATDTPCDALVQFGAGAVRDQTIGNSTFSRRHRAILEGLTAGTRYTFLIKSRTAEGSEAVHLSDKGFATPVLAAPALESPTHPAEDRWFPSREIRVAWEPVPGAARYVARLAAQRITQLGPADTALAGPAFAGVLEGDGVWWLAVAGVDEAGNVGDAALRALRCDTAAGVPSVTSPTHPDSAKWSNLPVVELEAKGTDSGSGVDGFLFAIGRIGEAWDQLAFQRAPAAKWALPRLPDGTWEVYVRLRDQAGNESQPTSHRVQIDTAPPTVVLDPPPALARAGELELAWQVKDERSGIARILIQQRRDGDAGAAWETAYEGKGTAVRVRGEDGWRMRYRVVAEDRAGMQAAAETQHAVVFDGSPPAPVTLLEARSLAGGDVLLKWGPVEDALSEVVRYAVYRGSDEGRLGMKVGTVAAGVLEFVDDGSGLAHGGRYWYRVGSEDALGNAQTEGVDAQGICDKEAPAPVLRSRSHPPDQWTTLTDAEIEWDPPRDDSGIKEYVWRLDRNPASTLVRGVDGALAEPALKLSRLADGLWYAHVAAVDGAGNMSSVAHYPLRIVTRPPHARLRGLPS
ncbi:MAG: hypothetical protein AAB368_03170, partial [bacterium]